MLNGFLVTNAIAYLLSTTHSGHNLSVVLLMILNRIGAPNRPSEINWICTCQPDVDTPIQMKTENNVESLVRFCDLYHHR